MAPTRHDLAEHKSLTPQRKHRKLLKDGSGTEVWPEAIEKIFVQGLRQYWQSPWATYSRGRSRWRNQFLVDYLAKAGIVRTKKQVASHIQVLRNMWKGEREYHLVAGGEELFQESGLLAHVKLEERFDTSGLIALETEESDGISSSSNTSPNCSPPEFKSDLIASPMASFISPFPHFDPTAKLPLTPLDGLTSYPASPSAPLPPLSFSNEAYISPPPHWDYGLHSGTYSPSYSPQAPAPIFSMPHSADAALPASNSASGNSPSNRLIGFYLLADGMQPLSVKADAFIPQLSTYAWPVAMQTKLSIPPVDDTRCPPSLHGFIGSVSLAGSWSASAQCVTKVYSGKSCVSHETGLLQPSPTNSPGQPTTAFLPDSPLSRCRWFPAADVITQQVVIDGQTLLYLVHTVEQKSGLSTPTAELVSCQPYRPERAPGSRNPPQSQTGASASSYATASSYTYSQQQQQQQEPQQASVYTGSMQSPQQQYTSYHRQPLQPSLSYALSPAPARNFTC